MRAVKRLHLVKLLIWWLQMLKLFRYISFPDRKHNIWFLIACMEIWGLSFILLIIWTSSLELNQILCKARRFHILNVQRKDFLCAPIGLVCIEIYLHKNLFGFSAEDLWVGFRTRGKVLLAVFLHPALLLWIMHNFRDANCFCVISSCSFKLPCLLLHCLLFFSLCFPRSSPWILTCLLKDQFE